MSAWTCRSFDGKAAVKIVPPRPRIPWWKGLGADFEEKREPVSDIDTAAADSLKVLDPKQPIREADMFAPKRDPYNPGFRGSEGQRYQSRSSRRVSVRSPLKDASDEDDRRGLGMISPREFIRAQAK